ncbi:SCO2322 family protein [Kitasatospora sp. NA04385]|uniref:SCO2322 family protein n=1 Tax=Kitasatospora sp. NA04385 TaxID=2742135 RepID=UPI0034CDD3DC
MTGHPPRHPSPGARLPLAVLTACAALPDPAAGTSAATTGHRAHRRPSPFSRLPLAALTACAALPRPAAGTSAATTGHRAHRRPSPFSRRPFPLFPLAVLTLLAACAALLGPAAGTSAAAEYRYWSFWKGGTDGWAYQQVGPAGNVPADGAVDGWRFVLSPDGGQETPRPGPAPDFASVCRDTAPDGGHKRVAVVLDFGTAQDAPNGEQPPAARSVCASVPTAANSAEVLAAVAAPLRYDSGAMLCAIAGYPHAGCGEQVAAGGGSTAAAGGSDGDGGPSVGLFAGVGAVVLLGAGAVWQARRRRTR